MKTLTIILLLFFATGFRTTGELRLVSWVIVPTSSLSIEGSSNVSDFSCGMLKYGMSDTLVIVENTASHIKFRPNSLSIPVSEFNCRNKLITRDFRETLNAEDHPAIGVSFVSFRKMPSPVPERTRYNAEMLIELAGSQKNFIIQFDFFEKTYSQYHLTGSKVLKFSDFGFTPPTKAMGLVKVEDELTINFNLIIRPL